MILSKAPLFYPSAREWMWSYCMYLGPFTDSDGTNYDLGVFLDEVPNIGNRYVAAIVYGNTPGDYSSGDLKYGSDRECYKETIRRCEELNLFVK